MLDSIFQSLIHKNKGNKNWTVLFVKVCECAFAANADAVKGIDWSRVRSHNPLSNQINWNRKTIQNNRKKRVFLFACFHMSFAGPEQRCGSRHRRPDLKLDANAKWHKRSNSRIYARVNVVDERAPVRTFPIINCQLENAINCEFSLATRYWIIIIGSGLRKTRFCTGTCTKCMVKRAN